MRVINNNFSGYCEISNPRKCSYQNYYNLFSALENVYEYDNSEAFLIWAEALELKDHISGATEKAKLALKHATVSVYCFLN